MTGPSTVEERDYLEAVRMQLREHGAGEVSPDNLLDMSLHSEPDPPTMYDISTACDMTAAELATARDLEIAHFRARQDGEHVPAGPSSTNCTICMDATPTIDRFISSKCGHSFCKRCMRRHLEIIATDTHQFPLICPQCKAIAARPPAELDPQRCLAILEGTGAAHGALERLILERKHIAHIRYCANPACSTPFDWVDDPAVPVVDKFRVTCPSCNKETCVNCKVQWHVDRTCEQCVAEKEGTDTFANLARKEAWKACPKCELTIERQKGDCDFVRCKCGCGFCYNCGKEYLSLEETANNAHGIPNCTCGLFRNDEEPAAANGDQADEVVVQNDARLVGNDEEPAANDGDQEEEVDAQLLGLLHENHEQPVAANDDQEEAQILCLLLAQEELGAANNDLEIAQLLALSFERQEELAAANGEQADEVVAPNVVPHEPEPVQVQRVSVPTRLGTLVRSLWRSSQLPKRSGNGTFSSFLKGLKLKIVKAEK